jgi:predicted 3-demethylubiquinone-9 3-methyltransferase (glyoxalase superfamily)
VVRQGSRESGKVLRFRFQEFKDPENYSLRRSWTWAQRDGAVEFQQFVALNGGPLFKFTEAISFAVNCRTQAEVDMFWTKLSRGGTKGPCGWLKDRYGLSWQVNPTILADMLADPDPEKSNRVMKAMLQMKKIDIKRLKEAYRGKA